MEKNYFNLCSSCRLLLFTIALVVGFLPAMAQEPYEQNFNSVSSLPEGWAVDGTASAYMVSDDRDVSNKGKSLFCYLENTSSVVITPRVAGIVVCKVRPYAQKTASGSVTVYEYTKNGEEWVRGNEITSASKSWNKVTAQWESITIDCGTGKYLGFLLNKACLDNFIAAGGLADGGEQGGGEVTPTEVKKLQLTAFERVSDYEIVADENNEFTASFSVRVKNTGNVELPAADVSVSITDADGQVFGTATATEPLAVEAEATIAITIKANAGEGGYVPFYAKENVSNTFFLNDMGNKQAVNTHITAYYATFGILGADDFRMEAGETISFGYVNQPFSQHITLKNEGTAPLKVSSITLPEGYSVAETTFDVAAASQKVVDITLTPEAGKYGQKKGNVVITHDLGTFTFAVEGTTIDPSANFIDFEDQKIPEKWTVGEKWTIESRSGNYYLQQNDMNGTTTVVTQKVSVAEGAAMSFMARKAFAYSAAALSIYYSADGESWTLAQTYEGLTTGFEVYTLSGIPAGNYFLKIEAQYVHLDNIVLFPDVEEVPKMAVFDADSKLLAAAAEYDFGSVDTDATTTYTINNVGTGTLVATVSVSEGFTVDVASVELAAGQSKTITVTMTAQPYGQKQGTLTIQAEGQTDVVVTLKGESLDPTTGIVLPVVSAGNGVFFNLQGQRVGQLRCGSLYVHNGKKILKR